MSWIVDPYRTFAVDPPTLRITAKLNVARLADRMLRLDLTPRELQTLELLANGSTNKQIAKALHLSDHAIRHYVSNIMEKLEVSDRTEAVAIAFKNGLLKNPGTN